jgi:hypothetical protein
MSPILFVFKKKIRTKSGQFHQMSSKGHAMESKSKRTPIGLNLIAPGKWKQVSEEV